jgi:multidrug efflux pump
MTLPEVCIKRPVFATVLSLAVLLVGAISYSRMAVREYPKIDEPVVNVETVYRGASADVIESQVTKVLEDSLSGIEGVDIMSSSSRSEASNITIVFKLSRDPDAAAADVRDKVSRVRGRLPQDIDEPIIAKTEADAWPILWIGLTSDKHSRLDVSDYASRQIRPRLQTMPGAADVRVFGERRPSMRIWLDRSKLAAYKLTPADVEDALRRQNVEIPAGRIESRAREFAVLSQTDLATPEQFGAAVVRDAGGIQVRIRDVARIELAPANERVVTRFNGRPSVSLGVIRQSTANALDLSIAVRKEIAEIQKSLPEGMRLELAFDSSVFIDESVKAVTKTIIEAVLLVALVIFVFLRNVRATMIPLVTIPVSLIGAGMFLYAAGFSINTLTLLAMVLAVGLVVDDAIVVLENIYRYMESGMTRLEAALKGTREIAFAVIAMTFTLAAVYAPLAFVPGRTGKLFTEFAVALAGSVVVSGFVALTLSPMMCSMILKHEPKHGRVFNFFESLFTRLTLGYKRALLKTLDHRMLVLVVLLLVGGSSVPLYMTLKQELAPVEDRGAVFIPVSAPVGSTVAFTAGYMERIEKFYADIPETLRFFVMAGNPTPDNGFTVLNLKRWDEREKTQQQVARELIPKLQSLPGVLAFPINPPSLGGARGQPLQFVVMTQQPYPELQRMVERLMEEARKNPNLVNVDSDLRLNQPELRVGVNREKLADVGVPVETVGRTLETLLGGRIVTRFKRDGEQYDVLVQVADADRTNPRDITDIYVRGRNGEMIQLANVLTVSEGVAPKNLNHFQKLRSATVSAGLAPGYTVGQAVDYMQATAKRVVPEAVADLSGQSREYRDAAGNLALVLVLAVVFIYLVLAAQFESFRDPLIILLSVPLSMAGAFAALHLTGSTWNTFSQIGAVTLLGLITKHGILIVEFSNQLQEKGMTIHDAVVEAAVLRLRPILMTTGAMVLGALPLALAVGAGAESRKQIGWVIVGGMLVGTLFTLFVIPTAYSLLAARHRTFEDRLAADRANATGQPAAAD